MAKIDKINTVYMGILTAGVLEDRREYDNTMLAQAYPELNNNEIDILERLIQANFAVYANSDTMIAILAKELAGDIQMEIDDHDIGSNMTTMEWLSRRGLMADLVTAIDVYRTNP